jgi:hypothetical protein
VIDVEYLNEPLRLINLEDDEMAMSSGALPQDDKPKLREAFQRLAVRVAGGKSIDARSQEIDLLVGVVDVFVKLYVVALNFFEFFLCIGRNGDG